MSKEKIRILEEHIKKQDKIIEDLKQRNEMLLNMAIKARQEQLE